MTITYTDSIVPSGQAYSTLIESTGWQGIVERGYGKMFEAVSNSWYFTCVYDGDRLIGSGRIISDGVYQALIVDVIVLPEYQGNGIGKEIMKRLLKKCNENDVLMVSLFAAPGKSGYYNNFGFVDRPQDAPGMRWVNRNLD